MCTIYDVCVGELMTINNRKAINNSISKLMVETKTAQYKHDIEVHFTEKEKRTQIRKLKRFQKDVDLLLVHNVNQQGTSMEW